MGCLFVSFTPAWRVGLCLKRTVMLFWEGLNECIADSGRGFFLGACLAAGYGGWMDTFGYGGDNVRTPAGDVSCLYPVFLWFLLMAAMRRMAGQCAGVCFLVLGRCTWTLSDPFPRGSPEVKGCWRRKAGGLCGADCLSIATRDGPRRQKSWNRQNCIARARRTDCRRPHMRTMSLEERLSKIRDNPKLQGQQQVTPPCCVSVLFFPSAY